MPDETGKSIQKSTTPLRIIALFLGFAEAVAGLALTQATGGVQTALTAFVIGFPILVAGAFFTVLWNRNYVFYPPTEFGDGTNVKDFVGAMRPPEKPEGEKQLVQSTTVASAAVAAEIVGELPKETLAKADASSATDRPEEGWWLAYRAKEYDKAFTLLQRWREAGKTDPEFARALGGRILLEKDRAEGLAYFEATFQEMPTATLPYTFLASTYMAWEQFDDAFRVIDRGIAAHANFVDLTETRARVLNKMGRLDDAIAALKTAIEREPKSTSPYILGASLFEGAKDVVQADIWYRMALDVDPQSESALLPPQDGSDLYHAAVSSPAGVYAVAKALSADTAHAFGLVPGAGPWAQEQQGRPWETPVIGKALATYEKADELAKHQEGWIIANIGNLMTNRGLYPKAVNFLKEAVSLEPESAYAHERLAAALRAAEEEDEKEKELLATLKPKPLTEGGS